MYDTLRSRVKHGVRQINQPELPFNVQRDGLQHHEQCSLLEASAERLGPPMATLELNRADVPVKPRKPTYRQDWPAYNRAQTNEKAEFQSLLFDLCHSIQEPLQTIGRPRVALAELIFCVVLKVYCAMSGRRTMWELRQAKDSGYISKAIHYNTLSKYLQREDLAPYLTQLIQLSALPLNIVERNFAADSSGFSTGTTQKWGQVKWDNARIRYGEKQPNTVKKKDWVKLHIMCGVTTNVVAAAIVTHAHGGDHAQFKPLVEATSENFVIDSVAADKAYSSYRNLQLVVSKAGMPYIAFKENANPSKTSPSVWKRMYRLYDDNREDFLRHYHLRSNVETTFSMIKAKFGERVRSKTWPAQANEVLSKVLAHNLCCLIQSMFELGIDPRGGLT